jgi:hypothetical protein
LFQDFLQWRHQCVWYVGGVAGDGTTTPTVLARRITAEGTKMVAARHDPMARQAADPPAAAGAWFDKRSRDVVKRNTEAKRTSQAERTRG